MSCCTVSVVFGGSNSGLPFTCPFEIPEDLPQPGQPDGGLEPTFNTDRVDAGTNAQFRAAGALVPCDATAIQIFVEDDIPERFFSVSVIFVFSKVVEELKQWLKEKFHAEGYENPIRDAVFEECPEIVYQLNNPYGSKLTGDEILNILCNDNCTRSTNPKEYHALAKRSDTYNSYNPPKPQYQQHHYPPQQLSYNTPQHHTVTNTSAHYTPGESPPIIYQQPQYPTTTAHYSPTPTPHSQYPQHTQTYHSSQHQKQSEYPAISNAHHNNEHGGHGYNLLSEHQKQAHSPYYKKVLFDDAPDIVYGVAIRTRRIQPCEEVPKECEQLINEDRIVECNQPRFSACDGEWLDCIPEDERYLRNETDYYTDRCSIETFDFGGNSDLENASDTECNENRCSLAFDNEPHVGFDADNACDPDTCDANNEKEPEYSPNRYTKQYNTRYTRQNEPVVTNAEAEKWVQSTPSSKQTMRDRSVTHRTGDISTAQGHAKTFGRTHSTENLQSRGLGK